MHFFASKYLKTTYIFINYFCSKYALSANTKILLTLRFYACGNFLITVGDFCVVSISAASRAVKEVSTAIASLSKAFIKFPQDTRNTVAKFYNIAKFPKVVGAIDCTHVRIQSPGGDDAEIYRNRKGFFSFNVQAVCDANLIFEDLVARWPGSSHDSNIFRHSRLSFRMESGEFKNLFLLGDSGYQVNEFMMTPLLNPTSEAEKLYNESQIRTRNCIERCFGVWKRRFPVLAMGIRLSIKTTMAVIVACAVLHNITTSANDPLPETDISLPLDNWNQENNDVVTNKRNTRTVLIADYFGLYVYVYYKVKRKQTFYILISDYNVIKAVA